jgi:hypothetical protein
MTKTVGYKISYVLIEVRFDLTHNIKFLSLLLCDYIKGFLQVFWQLPALSFLLYCLTVSWNWMSASQLI